jgi:PAS domain S-box-containing protein
MGDWDTVDPAHSGVAGGMASQVWNAVGAAFFRELTSHLSSALDAHLVYIGELCSRPVDRLIVLATNKNGTEINGFEYEVGGTSVEEMLAHGMSIHERSVRRVFPSDPVLEKAGGEAFAGKALFDSRGQPIGAIVAVWRHPLSDSSRTVAMLEAIAPRAAAELERKRGEDSLRASEQRYQAFIAASSDAMWRVEFEEPIPIDLPEDEQIDRIYRYGYIDECNQATVRIYAPGASSVIGARVGSILPRTEMRIQYLRELIRMGYNGAHFVTIQSPEGNLTYVVSSLMGIVEDGKLLRVWGSARDIGDLRKAELEWHASERRFRQILETNQIAALMLDAQGRVMFCNDFLLTVTGWSRDDFLGGEVFDMMIPAEDRDKLRSGLADQISGRVPRQHYEGRLLRRDGTHRLTAWDSTVLLDTEGKATGVAVLGRDITDQKVLEARLREADKLESVRRLAGAIAHDFNNLLMVIMGYGSELLEASEDDSQQKAAAVVQATEQGVALTRQLLSFSRDLPVKPQPVQVNTVITDNENMLRHLLGKMVGLVCDLDPSPPAVMADPGQIHQVLVNLAMNARDAMPGGGTLSITTRTVEVDEIRPAAMPDVKPGTYVVLDVGDTGTGIPEDVRVHIFEPFFTTKQGSGTGLGLASVYGIVRQSGGYISVESTPGKGATFHILLPALSAPC